MSMEPYREEGYQKGGVGFPLGVVGCVKNEAVGGKVFVLKRGMSIKMTTSSSVHNKSSK